MAAVLDEEQNIGTQIDTLQKTRESIRSIEAELKVLKEQKATQEAQILSSLDELGIDKASGKLGSVYISEALMISIDDPAKFFRFAKQHNAPELYERRAAQVACREWLEQRKGRAIPGTRSFPKRTLNLRNRDD
jgi:hypothetical protein